MTRDEYIFPNLKIDGHEGKFVLTATKLLWRHPEKDVVLYTRMRHQNYRSFREHALDKMNEYVKNGGDA